MIWFGKAKPYRRWEAMRCMPWAWVVDLDEETIASPLHVNPPPPSTGWVVAAGSGCGLEAGDRVIVNPGHGKALADVNDYGFESRLVRCQGVVGARPVKTKEHVLAKIDYEGRSVNPVGSHILIARTPYRDRTEGGLYIPEGYRFRDGVARVIAVGPDVDYVRPGDKIVYSETAIVHVFGPGAPIAGDLNVDSRDLAFLDSEYGAFAVIEE